MNFQMTNFLPLGGCGEIGMNLNLYGYGNRWLMVDCGITFNTAVRDKRGHPTIEMPDPQFIVDRISDLEGLIVTHAHEDHMGAIPYLWPKLNCPVYATCFAAHVLRQKSIWRRAAFPAPLIEIVPKQKLKIGDFSITFLPITHSTPETCALLIETPSARVLHTADWKIDSRPVLGPSWVPADWADASMAQIDAVICDSTNANQQGKSFSEGEVGDALLRIMATLRGRVVVACFASNVARVMSILRAGKACSRRVALFGRSLEIMVRAAQHAGLMDDGVTFLEPAHAGYLPEAEVLAIATGTQGEVRSALYRLLMDTHPNMSLSRGDTVIFSSKTIPGNEAAVEDLVNGFRSRGIAVIQADEKNPLLHSSGHPYPDDLRLLYQQLKPKLVVPVHGEVEHMQANAGVARSQGVPMTITGRNGDLFHLGPAPGIRRGWAPVGRLRVDEKNRKLLPVEC